jgi:hypothetical protein
MGANYGNVNSTIDISFPDGSDNTPGISQNVYHAFVKDIAVLPKAMVTDPLQTMDYELEHLVTVTDNIVMKPDKRFTKLYCTLEEGELKSTLQGLRDGKSFKQELSTYFPGSKEQFHGFVSLLKNSASIFVVPDLDGNKYIFGSACYPANLINFDWTTSKKSDERKGGMLQFDFNTARSLYFFKGNIILTDAANNSGLGLGAQPLVYCN